MGYNIIFLLYSLVPGVSFVIRKAGTKLPCFLVIMKAYNSGRTLQYIQAINCVQCALDIASYNIMARSYI